MGTSKIRFGPSLNSCRQRQDDPKESIHMTRDLLSSTWYTTDEVARLLGVDASSVRRWRTTTPFQGPPFIRLSARKTVYNADDVEAWLQSRRVQPQGSPR